MALDSAAQDTVNAAASDASDIEAAAAAGACSFSADTQVATLSGKQAIASLHLGDTVLADDRQGGTRAGAARVGESRFGSGGCWPAEQRKQWIGGNTCIGTGGVDIESRQATRRDVACSGGRPRHQRACWHARSTCRSHFDRPGGDCLHDRDDPHDRQPPLADGRSRLGRGGRAASR